ncbi:MAG TPA: prepilin-type N-terminal cleavage/methylation domain-containing protein [bacterium]|nr:prepilin-type N-terminal cleavage/methylation domain-containing protein [bacterium]
MNAKAEHGSTLIEIVVVLVLLGLLLSMVALRVDLRSPEIESSLALLRTHLLQAKLAAMASGQRAGIRFDSQNARYEGAVPADSDRQRDPFRNQPIRAEIRAQRISTNLSGDAVFFDSFGHPYDGNGDALKNQGWVEIQNGEAKRKLWIEPLTGFVHP